MAEGDVTNSATSNEAEDSDWQRVEREITCTFCQGLFTEPKTIPCLHTFCEKCIKQMKNNGETSCSICGKELACDVAAIPTNTSTKRLVEIVTKRKSSASNRICGECDDNTVAVMWCVDCENFLCEECYKQHGRMKKLKSHKTRTIEHFNEQSLKGILGFPKPEYCKDHVTQPLDLYCMTCSSLICRDCTYVDHREHQYSFVNKLADVEREKIKVIATPLKKMLEQVRDGLAKVQEADNDLNNETDAEVQLKEMYCKLHEMLNKQEKKDLEKVSQVKSSLLGSLQSQRGDLRLLENLIVSCDEFVTKVSTVEESSQLLIHRNDINNTVAELTSQVERTNLEPVCGVENLVLSTSNLDNLVSQLTSVCSVSTLPHVPNCSVKGPAAMSKYGPVKLTVTLKDKDGLYVPNQSEHLRVDFKRENFTGSVKVEETPSGVYTLSYRLKRREAHSVSVSWKGNLLGEVEVPVNARDYSTVQETTHVISHHGSQNENKLDCPHLLAVGPNDEVIVRDCHIKKLVVFDRNLKFSCLIDVGESDPTGLAVSKKGHLYISDGKSNSIKKFKMSGELISKFGTEGNADGRFCSPRGIVVTQSDLVCVCDKDNHRIQVLNDMQLYYMFGKKGEQPGYLTEPFDLALNSTEELLFISDCKNCRVQLFTLGGQFLKLFGDFTNFPKSLLNPTGICYAPDGHVLTCISQRSRVLIFDEDGTQVSTIEGTYKGKRRFEDPVGIVMKSNGQIVIAGCKSHNLVAF